MQKLELNVANSKSLVDATKKSLTAIDNGDEYQVQFTFQTGVIGGLNATNVNTFLSKCRQAIGQFKDDLALKTMSVVVEKDQTKFNQELVQKTHKQLITDLGINSGPNNDEEDLPIAAKKA